MSSERARALHLLQRIEREQLYASLLLLGESGFVRTVVLGVLRWRSRLDFVIAELAQRAVKKLDPPVVDVLRVGLYQLLYMDVAQYAAVSETVDLAPKRARGFVNAILRRVTRDGVPEPRDPATRHGHPQWLFERWARTFGSERAEKIAAANQELSYPDVLALGDEEPPNGERSSLLPTLWKLHGGTAELDRERFYPMDEGSAVIAAIAQACGDDVLDLAAAPGGKTIYMEHHGARVVSNDVSIARLRVLRGAAPASGADGGRSGHRSTVVSDGRRPPFRRRFDVVLLDAPCSATGTIRKNPEIKWRLREEELQAFAKLQRELLESALSLASQYVVYSTCSLEPEENDAVVGSEHVDITPFVPEGARSWVENGVLRLTPESGADGFTAFVLNASAHAA
ncbi:MAG TPA: transcription antitermination factor NusB [Thermoanaerobaculia bacterium]|nr:transcription antitermination factor NusB [Thermoanaerobaculia bacterium]